MSLTSWTSRSISGGESVKIGTTGFGGSTTKIALIAVLRFQHIVEFFQTLEI